VAVNLCIVSTTCVSNTTDLFQSVIDILTASLYTWLRKRKLNLYDLVLKIQILFRSWSALFLSERNDSERRWIELYLMLNTDLVASVIDMTKSDRHWREEVQFVSRGVERRFGCECDRHWSERHCATGSWICILCYIQINLLRSWSTLDRETLRKRKLNCRFLCRTQILIQSIIAIRASLDIERKKLDRTLCWTQIWFRSHWSTLERARDTADFGGSWIVSCVVRRFDLRTHWSTLEQETLRKKEVEVYVVVAPLEFDIVLLLCLEVFFTGFFCVILFSCSARSAVLLQNCEQ
jgi:hypothetical protein